MKLRNLFKTGINYKKLLSLILLSNIFFFLLFSEESSESMNTNKKEKGLVTIKVIAKSLVDDKEKEVSLYYPQKNIVLRNCYLNTIKQNEYEESSYEASVSLPQKNFSEKLLLEKKVYIVPKEFKSPQKPITRISYDHSF